MKGNLRGGVMIQDIAPEKYRVEYKPVEPEEEDPVFVFCGHKKREQRILLRRTEEGGLDIPKARDLLKAKVKKEELQFLFAIESEENSRPYFLLMRFENEADAVSVAGYSWEPIRSLRCCRPKTLCFAGMTAYQLYDWYRINQFCGVCGTRTLPFETERAMYCPRCGNLIFPKICPAVIVGVENPYYDEQGKRHREKDQIIVSRYAGREYKGVALLAGFCEIGETPEDTVAREVMEEVGIKVKNIRYYKSQPWGFDSNLLLGFYAEADGSTTIVRDASELASAEWASREDLEKPDENLLALTGTMIDAFICGEDGLQ